MTKVIGLMASFGAGKSTTAITLAEALVAEGYLPQQIAIAVNEAGGTTEIETKNAMVVVLPNGCFTCQDEADLQRELRQFEADGVEFVIMEGFGLVPGHETAAFLEKSTYSFQLIGLVDVANFAANQVRYSENVASHVAAATAGVILTKVSSVISPEVQQFLQETVRRSVPVYESRQGQPVMPVELLQRACATRMPTHRHHAGCGHHGHNHAHRHHNHNHDHDHDHHASNEGMMAIALKPEVTINDLQAVFADLVAQGSVRLKGQVEQTKFNLSPGSTDWNTQKAESGLNYLISYFLDDVGLADVPGLMSLSEEVLRGHQILRIDPDPTKTRKLIQEDLAWLRTLSVQTSGVGGQLRLVTHPERAQSAKEMTRRPAQADLFPVIMEQSVRYWTTCVEWLRRNDNKLLRNDLATHQRELGVSLAWWLDRFGSEFTESVEIAGWHTKPAVLMAKGALSLNSLRSDEFWRPWQIKEFAHALGFGLDTLSSEELQLVHQAAQHLAALTTTDEERQYFDQIVPVTA